MNNLRVGLLAILTALFLSPCLHAQSKSVPATPGQPAAVVSLVGEIDDYSRDDLIRRIEKAKTLGAKVIIVSIDSPGGMVTSSMEISRYLKRQTDVRTIAFVKEKAYSGAAMVAVACDEIWMAPDSPLGDCAPIVFSNTGGLQALPETERAKQESPVVDEFLDSARRNGYSPLLLAAMVSLKNPVAVVQNDKGELRVVSEADFNKGDLAKDGWKIAPGYENVDGAGKLVTVYPPQAIALGLAKGQAPSAQALAATLGDPLVADLTPSFGEELVHLLSHPLLRMLFLIVFFLSLNIALHAPGHGAAEAMAVVSLGLLLGVPLLTGYATWWEVGIIFIGLALCAFEIFVFPGHMVSLALGSVMVIVGLVLTFVPMGLPGWLPSTAATVHGVRNGMLVILGAFVCWLLLSMWLRRYLPSIPYFRKLILTATTGNAATSPMPGDRRTGDVWPFVGTVGVAATDLRPGGSVMFPYGDAARTAAVVSAAGYLPQGTKVVVEEIQGSSVRVRPIS